MYLFLIVCTIISASLARYTPTLLVTNLLPEHDPELLAIIQYVCHHSLPIAVNLPISILSLRTA
jgi:hypothetical protein